MTTDKLAALKALRTPPGIGAKLAGYLYDMGYRHPDELKAKTPDELYAEICQHFNEPVDRCVLYVFRAVTYSLTTKNPDPAKLKWWAWQDRK